MNSLNHKSFNPKIMKRNTLYKLGLIGLFIINSLLLSENSSANQNELNQEKPAPVFSIPNHEGQLFSLKKLNQNGAVVVFLSTQCPVSNAYTSRLIDLARYAKKNKLTFLGINSNATEDISDILSHAKRKQLNFVVLKDEGNLVADRYGAKVTPEVFFIDNDFKIRYHGPVDDNQRRDKVKQSYLKNAINAYLEGEEINPSEVEPKGCIIKRMR